MEGLGEPLLSAKRIAFHYSRVRFRIAFHDPGDRFRLLRLSRETSTEMLDHSRLYLVEHKTQILLLLKL